MHSTEEDAISTRPKSGKKVFHGWYIVAVGFVIQLAFATSLSSTLGVFFKPMSEEFGWNRTFLSGVRSFEGVLAGVAAMAFGPILDRRGAREVMVAGSLVGGAGLILLGRINSSLQFFVVRALVVCLGMAAVSNNTLSVALSNWFVVKRGRAIGISGAGLAAGKLLLAPMLTLLITAWSWREAWMVLGLAVLLLVPIPAALVVRRRPEDMGLLPDGANKPGQSFIGSSKTVSGKPGLPIGEVAWKARDAVRTPTFWLIVLTFGVSNIGAQGLALHTIPYLTDVGFTPTAAATAISILSVFQLCSTLSWGFLSERFPIRLCATAKFLVGALGVAMLLLMHDPALIVVGLVIYGFSLGGGSVLQDVMWANYFGRVSLGTIRSLSMPPIVLFNAIGPLYFGYLYDVTGNYTFSFLGFLIALVTASFLVWTCRPPKRSSKSALA